MSLPTQAITVLLNLKKELIQRELENAALNDPGFKVEGVTPLTEIIGQLKPEKKEKKQPQTFRGRRARPNAVQRCFHRRDFWCPTY